MNTLNLKFFKRKSVLVPTFILISIAVISTYGFRNRCESFETTTTAMGTYVTQILCGPCAKSVCLDVNNKIKVLENQISWRLPDSDIHKINSSTEPVKISKTTADILALSTDIAKKSNGAFNPTILPLSSLWDFGGANNVPCKNEIEKVLPMLDYSNLCVDLDNLTAYLRKKSGIDLGAVGKGAACDVAIEEYKKSGASFGVISVGGSIGVFGHKPNNEPFKIAIRNPFDQTDCNNSFAILNIFDGCVSTSGSYERSFCSDGNFYHHILDSSTGYPTENDLVCVTVIHQSGVLTDLLSTACFVLGVENSVSLLSQYEACAVFVDKNKNVFASSKLKNSLKITNSEFQVCKWY